MFKINDDLSIFVTRGDAVVFNLHATTDKGETYIFKPEDVVRIKIMERKGCEDVVFQKVFVVEQETDTVEISLSGEETTIGSVISKPTDYWYEVELNPFTIPQTIIGYDDETGAKIFKLFPEGNSELKAKDIPIVDRELDLYSDRPVQNQAIAWAVTNAINEMHITTEKAVEDTVTITNEAIAEVNTITENAVNEVHTSNENTIAEVNTITENAVNEVHTSNENTLAEVNTLVGEVREELQNVPNAENMANLQSQITENKNSISTNTTNISNLQTSLGTTNTNLGTTNTNIANLTTRVANIEGVELTSTLTAGATSLTFTNSKITTNSTVDIYSSVYGVNPKTVTLSNGSIAMTFKAQSSDVSVKVVVK